MIKSSQVLACLVLGLTCWSLPACGGDDSDSNNEDAASECKRLAAAECQKFYKCYTADELSAAKDIVGTSESDCEKKVLEQNDCTCEDGKTYNGGQADKCVDAFESYSCDEFMGLGTTTDTPDACDKTCE